MSSQKMNVTIRLLLITSNVMAAVNKAVSAKKRLCLGSLTI